MYPALKAAVLSWGDFGKITIPQILGIKHWQVIVVLVVLGVLLFLWFEKKVGSSLDMNL
jgi:hypothetical protein